MRTALGVMVMSGLLFAWGSLAVRADADPPEVRLELPPLRPAPDGVDAHEVAVRAEDVLRADDNYIVATMTVVSPRLPGPRKVRFRSWDDRVGKRSFIRILEPPKDAQSAFLLLYPNLWMYVPRVERTMRIPPSMMLQSWMGSDFTNDDLVKSSSTIDDYTQRMLGIDPEPAGHPGLQAYVVEYVPNADAAVVWGRLVTWIEIEHATSLRVDFYDEDGTRLRQFDYGDIREVEGRLFPHRWRGMPLDKEGHSTTIQIEEIRFNEKFDDMIFSMSHLKETR